MYFNVDLEEWIKVTEMERKWQTSSQFITRFIGCCRIKSTNTEIFKLFKNLHILHTCQVVYTDACWRPLSHLLLLIIYMQTGQQIPALWATVYTPGQWEQLIHLGLLSVCERRDAPLCICIWRKIEQMPAGDKCDWLGFVLYTIWKRLLCASEEHIEILKMGGWWGDKPFFSA